MPKKGKKKGKKRATKAEKLQAAEESQMQQRYAQIRREIQYGAETVRRHEKKWRAMLAELAVPRLRAEMEWAWHHYEHALDDKDFTISLLLDELHQSETQHLRLVKGQIEDIDRLLLIRFDQSNALWNESINVINALYKAANVERADIVNTEKEHEDFFKALLFTEKYCEKDSDLILRGAQTTELRMEKTNFEEIRDNLIYNLQNDYTVMFDEAQEFMESYRENFNNKKDHYKLLETNDVQNTNEIAANWRKIERYYRQIVNLRSEIDEVRKKLDKELGATISMVEQLHEEFKRVQADLRVGSHMDSENLTNLTLVSNDALEYMAKVEKEGERMLKVTAVNRKLEALDEKIAKFPLFDLPKEMIPLVTSSGPSPDEKEMRDDEEKTGFDFMQTFWNRVGKAELRRFNMTEQCRYLCEENAKLKMAFLEYCEVHSCEPRVLRIYENIAAFKYSD